MLKYIIPLLLCSQLQAQEVKLTLGVGIPFGDNDIFNGKINHGRWSIDKGDVIGSFIVTLPLKEIDLSVWHHSLLNSDFDSGVTGLSLSKTWSFKF